MVRFGRRVAAACVLAVLAAAAPAAAQPEASWGRAPGWEVFTDKGCVKCHRVRGAGEGTAGPDLARPGAATDLFSLGAAMWNHLPKMGAAMRALQLQRPLLTPIEISSLASFLFTVQRYEPSGNVRRGQRLFSEKSCAQCHALGGSGPTVGPALDPFARASSPVHLAAAMWNHSPAASRAMATRGIEQPRLQAADLADIMAYIAATSRPPGGEAVPVVAGSPVRGKALLANKGCGGCHAVEDAPDGEIAPRLGTRAHHVGVTEFGALLWNHQAGMRTAMKERGLAMPVLTAEEVADITAYLHTVHYFDPAAGRSDRGQALVASKGCLGCHSIYRQGGKTASDLAVSNVVGSPAGQVAAMWNHGRLMEIGALRRGTALPRLTGQEVADISTYLAGLGRGAPKPR